MADDPSLVRPATAAEVDDVGSMHAANRAAWDEAAERYEGWFDEAVALIRSGGTNLFGVETELIGDLHGRCRRAVHLHVLAAGTRCRSGTMAPTRSSASTSAHGCSISRLGSQPRPGRPPGGSWPTSSRRRPTWTGPLIWSTPAAARSSGWVISTPGRPSSPASSPRPGGSCFSRVTPSSGCSTSTPRAAGSPPTTTTSAAPRRCWPGARVSRRLSIADEGPELEVRPRLDAGRDRHSPARRGPAPRAGRRVSDRLVGRSHRRSARGERPDPTVVLGDGAQGTRLKLSASWSMDGCPWRDRTDDDVEARTRSLLSPRPTPGHIPHDPGARPPMTSRHARDLARLSIVGGLLVALLAACGGSVCLPIGHGQGPRISGSRTDGRPIDRGRIRVGRGQRGRPRDVDTYRVDRRGPRRDAHARMFDIGGIRRRLVRLDRGRRSSWGQGRTWRLARDAGPCRVHEADDQDARTRDPGRGHRTGSVHEHDSARCPDCFGYLGDGDVVWVVFTKPGDAATQTGQLQTMAKAIIAGL